MINQKVLENVKYFKYFNSLITNESKCKREIKSRISITKAAYKNNRLLTKKLALILRNKLLNSFIWRIVLYCAEILTFRSRSSSKNYIIWCWRKMEISWNVSVRKEEVLRGVKKERNILHTTKRRKANWSVISCIGNAFQKTSEKE
jgi:hypothetical protein